jgi:Predicted signal transduction protein with a C-terminal ATPase domain
MSAFNTIKKYMNNLSLKKKITLIALTGFCIVAFSAAMALNVVIRVNNQIISNSIASSLSYSSNEINNILNTVDTTSDLIMSDANIQRELANLLRSPELTVVNNARTQVYNALNTHLFNNEYISYISIHQENLRIFTSGHSPINLSSSAKDILEEEANNTNGKSTWVTPATSDNGVFLTRKIREIKNTSLANLGILVIRIDMNKLINSSTQFITQYQNAEFVLLNNDHTIYSTIPIVGKELKELTDFTENYLILDIDGKNYFAVNGYLEKTNWTYLCLIPYEQVSQSITNAYIISIALIISSIILAIFISSKLAKNMTKHFDVLLKKMNNLTEHDLKNSVSNYDYSSREDEIGILHNHFDRMIDELNTLINDNYVKQLLIKDATLKALETQINPHFLYNILESINWRAKAIEEEQISLMVESLGTLLRVTLKQGNDIVTLAQEIDFLKNYINIQQIRFEDRVHFHLDLDENTLDSHFPKLSIQPLVENAIHYSVETSTEDCNIHVISKVEQDILKIYVKNDGSEFAKNLLEKLKTRDVPPQGLGIGLVNIDSRIKLTFGDEYGLTLYNEDDMAIALISIPYQASLQLKEERD